VILAADPVRPGGLLLHRRVGRRPDGSLITKGDANALPDSTPVPAANLPGLARLRVPAVGVPVLRARTGDPLPAGALVVMTAILVAVPVGRRGRHAR
jgi:signal peptidase